MHSERMTASASRYRLTKTLRAHYNERAGQLVDEQVEVKVKGRGETRTHEV